MIRVKVLVLPVEEQLYTGTVLDVDSAGAPVTLKFLLEILAEKHPLFKEHVLDPGTGGLRGYIRVAVNGRVVTGPDAVMQPGSEVVFFPAIAGG